MAAVTPPWALPNGVNSSGVIVVQQIEHVADRAIERSVVGRRDSRWTPCPAGCSPVHAVKIGIVILTADLAPDAVEDPLVHPRPLAIRPRLDRDRDGCDLTDAGISRERGSGDERKAHRR